MVKKFRELIVIDKEIAELAPQYMALHKQWQEAKTREAQSEAWARFSLVNEQLVALKQERLEAFDGPRTERLREHLRQHLGDAVDTMDRSALLATLSMPADHQLMFFMRGSVSSSN